VGSIVLATVAATLILAGLSLLASPLSIFFDDLQELVAPGGGAIALVVAARNRRGSGRATALATAFSVASACLGMLAWDLSGSPDDLAQTVGNAVFVIGASAGAGTIFAAIFGGTPRDRLVGVSIDTLIVFLAGIATVAAFWRQGMIPPDDRLVSVGPVLLVSAAAGSALVLLSRNIGWSRPGPWLLLLGSIVLGSSWLMWIGGLASPTRVDVSDFMFSAGLLLVASGVVAWDAGGESGRRFLFLSRLLTSLLPVSAIMISLGLLAVTRSADFGDPLGAAVIAVIVTSAIRQLHLFSGEARTRRSLASLTLDLQTAMEFLRLEIEDRKRLELEQETMRLRMVESQRLESIGRLAGGVAHDFNNLLTAIRGYADLTALRLPDGDEGQEDLEALRRATDQAAALTAQLLAFSRNQRLSPSVLDLGDVVIRIQPLLRRLLGERVELTVRTAPDLRRVLADPGQIESVIVNLAVNARDAIETGGRVTIETANVDLDREADLDHAEVVPGQYAMIAVSDSGIGMDEETIRRVFEPFFTTKGPGKGTGLGLSVVYGTIRQSGGYVGVTSTPGAGTTFSIYLPRTNLDMGPVPDIPRQPARPERVISGTILVAEDEEPVRVLLDSALRHAGHEVVSVGSGEEALAELETSRDFSLLLTDVVMPGMSGLDLAARARLGRPALRVICMSGYTPPEMDRATDRGVRFLAKPFTLDALERLIREALED
jgi:signal transduction histidine kinase